MTARRHSFGPDEAPEDFPLCEVLEAGWEHEIIDGAVVHTLGDDGKPIRRSYQLPPAMTPAETLLRVRAITPEMLTQVWQEDLLGMVDIIEVYAPGLIEPIATDLSIKLPELLNIIGFLCERYGVIETILVLTAGGQRGDPLAESGAPERGDTSTS